MEILTPTDYVNGVRKRPRRTLRPCDACRQRKTRCITGKQDRGKCAYCELRSSACTFEGNPPERPAPERERSQRAPPSQSKKGSPVTDGPSLEQAQIDYPSTTISHDPTTGDGTRQPNAASSSPISDFDPDASTLGLAQSRFAELYGLGSDMEPILMVRYSHLGTSELQY